MLEIHQRILSPPCATRRGHQGVRASFAGFTLIELLVVIAIIGILAALTTPMLASVQEKAKGVGCLSNQRNIGGALNAYSMSHNGRLIPIEDDFRGGTGWAYILAHDDYIPAPIDPAHAEIVHTMNPFRCPSGINEVNSVGANITSRDDPDGGKATAYSDPFSRDYVHCWYGINGSTWGAQYWPYVQSPLDDGTRTHPVMAQIDSPSRTPMIYDGWWTHNGKDERIHARHNGGRNTNLLFFDGHVQTLPTFELPSVRDPGGELIRWRY